MSRSETKTKRRKVWVNLYSWGPGQSCSTKASALRKFSGSVTVKGDRTAVPFIEARPGDVVLSREDVAELEDLLAPLQTGRVRALDIIRGRR